MHEELEKRMKQLQEDRKAYSFLLISKSEEQVDFKPQDEKWSIKEVVHHLYLSEQLTLNGLRSFDFDRKNEILGIKAKLRALILRLALRSKKKFKAPSLVRKKMMETKIPQAADIDAQWELLRIDLKDFLSNFPTDRMNKFIFVHPRAGKFNILQTLDFLIDHQKHHLNQLNGILSDKNFPLI